MFNSADTAKAVQRQVMKESIKPQGSNLENPLWEYALELWQTTCYRGWSERLQKQFGLNASIVLALGFAARYNRVFTAADMENLLQAEGIFHAQYRKKLAKVRQRAEASRPMGNEVWKTWEELLLKVEMQAMQVELASVYQHLLQLALCFKPCASAIVENLDCYINQVVCRQANEQELRQCVHHIVELFRQYHVSV